MTDGSPPPVRRNSIHFPKLQRPKTASLIVLKPRSQESRGGRTREWGKGERPAGDERTKGETQERRKDGTGRPRSQRERERERESRGAGEHDLGEESAEPGRARRSTAHHGQGFIRLCSHPSRGRREKALETAGADPVPPPAPAVPPSTAPRPGQSAPGPDP